MDLDVPSPELGEFLEHPPTPFNTRKSDVPLSLQNKGKPKPKMSEHLATIIRARELLSEEECAAEYARLVTKRRRLSRPYPNFYASLTVETQEKADQPSTSSASSASTEGFSDLARSQLSDQTVNLFLGDNAQDQANKEQTENQQQNEDEDVARQSGPHENQSQHQFIQTTTMRSCYRKMLEARVTKKNNIRRISDPVESLRPSISLAGCSKPRSSLTDKASTLHQDSLAKSRAHNGSICHICNVFFPANQLSSHQLAHYLDERRSSRTINRKMVESAAIAEEVHYESNDDEIVTSEAEGDETFSINKKKKKSFQKKTIKTNKKKNNL